MLKKYKQKKRQNLFLNTFELNIYQNGTQRSFNSGKSIMIDFVLNFTAITLP